MDEDHRTAILALAREKISEDISAAPAAIIKAVEDIFDKDDGRWNALTSALMRLGAERAVSMALREARNDARTTRMRSIRQRRQVTAGGRRQEVLPPTRGILDMELPNGSQLGAATVADIDNAIAQHKVNASAHIGWVKFYAALKAKMVKARVYSVGELFSEGELLQLTSANGLESPSCSNTTPPQGVGEAEGG